MVKRVVVFLLFLILISPYLLLIDEIEFSALNIREFGIAFRNTVWQSTLSCLAVILGGIWGGVALCGVREKNKLRFYEFSCLIPSILPPLFFVASVLQIFTSFPFGIFGIIIMHFLIYIGLASLFFHSSIKNKFQKVSELVFMEGASQFLFLRAILKNIKQDIIFVFIFLFIQFFTSFSIPLLVGHQTVTLETLVYNKVRTTGSISQAVQIGLLESAFIFILLMVYRPIKTLSYELKHIEILKSNSGLAMIVAPAFIFLVGSFVGTANGLKQFHPVVELLPLVLKSIYLSILVGVSLSVSLSLLAFSYRKPIFDKFVLSYVPLSTVLIGLAVGVSNFHLGYPESDIKYLLVMIILFLPTLYRFQLKTKLQSLEAQIEVAQLMGANEFLTFQKIVFPQVITEILFLSGLGAFWTIGDFAISQIIYGREITLALHIQNLVGSYRLELANVFVFLLLVLGLGIFLLFREAKHVFSQKY